MRRGARARGAVLGALLVFGATPAGADEAATACLAAHQDAQTQRNAGGLRAARESLLACGDPGCPQVLQDDCAQWLAAVDQSMPTVVIDARDRNGRDLSAVQVYCDGEERATRLDGKALDVDPGVRRFRFVLATAGGSPPTPAVDQELVVREGEKNRRIVVRFDYPPPPPPTVERPVPATAVVLGAVGLAGLGVAGVSFAIARSSESDLGDAACAPTCPVEDADAVDRADTVAVIAAGVGAAFVIGAGVLYFTRPSVTVGVAPGPRAASLVVDGRF